VEGPREVWSISGKVVDRVKIPRNDKKSSPLKKTSKQTKTSQEAREEERKRVERGGRAVKSLWVKRGKTKGIRGKNEGEEKEAGSVGDDRREKACGE